MANRGAWVRVHPLTPEQKAEITAACERLIAESLKPRFLPAIRPTEWNYPVDIRGRWRSNTYTFLTCYRSGFPENAGEEFDTPFARLDHLDERLGEPLFDIMWFRHTGRWWRIHEAVPLARALHIVATDEVLAPT